MGKEKILIRVFIIGVFWITALLQMLSDILLSSEDKIVTAFASTNAKMAESSLLITAEWKDGILLNHNENQKVLGTLNNVIGESKDFSIFNETRNNQEISYLKWKRNDKETIIETISFQKEKKVYGYMELHITDQMNDILSYKTKLEKAYKDLGAVKCNTVLKFYGEYPGQLSRSRQNQEVKHLFHNLKASMVSDINEDGIYTVYGYTKLIKEYMQIFRHKININVAFTYDEKRNVTNIYLATPILSDDY